MSFYAPEEAKTLQEKGGMDRGYPWREKKRKG